MNAIIMAAGTSSRFVPLSVERLKGVPVKPTDDVELEVEYYDEVTPTAIGTLYTRTGEVSFDSEAWYTLDGKRLNAKPNTKGIYVNNGKKVVIK